jgi:hypothetical protein
LLAGCPDPVKPRCPAGFVGDSSKPVEVEMLVTDGTSMMLSPVADGADIPMERPPQGGYVMYIGARAKNVDACGIEVAGRLIDPDTNMQLGFDARNTDMVKTADGWATVDPKDNSNESNVNACPDYFPKDRVNTEYILEMKVTDREKRTATVSHRVRLVCDPLLDPILAATCQCECSANYMLGQCVFGLDAGTD